MKFCDGVYILKSSFSLRLQNEWETDKGQPESKEKVIRMW